MTAQWFLVPDSEWRVLREQLPSRQWHWSCWEPTSDDPPQHDIVLVWATGERLGAVHTRVTGVSPAVVARCHAAIRAADALTTTAQFFPDGTAVL